MQQDRFQDLESATFQAERQAILDPDGEIVGLELLRPDSAPDAWRRALTGVATAVGWERFFLHRPAFVAVEAEFFKQELYLGFATRSCVWQVSMLNAEDREAVRAGIAAAREAGHAIAWTELRDTSDTRLTLACAGDWVRLDGGLGADQAQALARACISRGLRVIASGFGHSDLLGRAADPVCGAVVFVHGDGLFPRQRVSGVRMPDADRATLEQLHASLRAGGDTSMRVRLCEDNPELLLLLLMLTDVAWQPAWAHAETTDELLRGFGRGALLAWLSLLLPQSSDVRHPLREGWARSFLRPALFAQMLARRGDQPGGALAQAGFMVGFLAQVLMCYPLALIGTDAPVHVGTPLRLALLEQDSLLSSVFQLACEASRAAAVQREHTLRFPREVQDLFASSGVLAARVARHGSRQPPAPLDEAEREADAAQDLR